MYNLAIVQYMSVNKFEEILRYLHLTDNLTMNPDDKFVKVRPLFNMLNDNYVQYCMEEENLNVDESMAPYYGRHGAKQLSV